jgi:hypothetical protein
MGPGGRETVVAFRNVDGKLVKESELTEAFFVKLVGEYGLPEDR